MKTPTLLIRILILVLACHANGAEPSGERHIYKHVDDRDLAIYVTKPVNWSASDKRPAIVFFHGGGWTGGAPGQFSEHARYFASRGLVCFQVQYRLLDKKKSDPPTVCLRDARSAMRWVRRNTEKLGVDPDRIAAAGGSAGGHIAAALGTIDQHDEPGEDTSISPRPNALILFNPVFDNGPGGWGHKRVADNYKLYSPLHNISERTPPAIIFLGDKDKLVPVSAAQKFCRTMKKHGVDCRLHVFAGMQHGFFNFGRHNNQPYRETVRAADLFLCDLGWLKGPPSIETNAPAGRRSQTESGSGR